MNTISWANNEAHSKAAVGFASVPPINSNWPLGSLPNKLVQEPKKPQVELEGKKKRSGVERLGSHFRDLFPQHLKIEFLEDKCACHNLHQGHNYQIQQNQGAGFA